MDNTISNQGDTLVLIDKKELQNKILKAVEAMELAANETKDIKIFKALNIGFESLKDLINT